MRSSIEAIKAAVAIEDVAAEYTELRQIGERHYVGRCPAPDHEDRNPSFHVYADPEDQHYHCFSCGLHGDVIDLEEVCGRHIETWTAMVALSTRYGVELPRRSEKWLEAGGRKEAYKDHAYRVIGAMLSRRIYKVLVLPWVNSIEDAAERRAELERSWQGWQQASHRRFWELRAREISSGDTQLLETIARIYLENHPTLLEEISA